MDIEKTVKEFLDQYRDKDGDYFPEDLWSLENSMIQLLNNLLNNE